MFLRYYLWIAPHLFLGIFLWVFLRRGLHKQFPFFFSYVLFQLLDFLASLVTGSVVGLDPKHSLILYRWIVVSGLGIGAVISFGVIYELVNQLILSRSTLAQTLRALLRWSAAILFLLTAIASGRLAVSGVEKVMNVFQVLDFSSSALQVGLLMVLFLFSRVLRISWQSLPVGIALGLGILGCAELAAAPLLAALGAHRYAVVDVLRLATFHACVLVWLGYLVFPRREARFVGEPLQRSELEFWDQELQRMVQR